MGIADLGLLCYSARRSVRCPNASCRWFVVTAFDRKLDYDVISNPCRDSSISPMRLRLPSLEVQWGLGRERAGAVALSSGCLLP